MSNVPDAEALKLFISYSRSDAALADAFVDDLEARGFDVVIDRRDLPYGEEWQKELSDFIQASDTVVWLVSPASLASRWVNWELGEVQRVGKRLLPIAIAPVARDALPDVLGKIHILPAEGVYEAARHLDDLTAALETDRAWIKEGSRLGDRAREWIARGRASDRLLRGAALRDAAAWRARQPARAPQPTQETMDLIAASERGAKTRARWTVAGLSAGVAIMAGLAVAALVSAETAQRNAEEALSRRDEALTNQSQLYATLSDRYREDGDWARAMFYAWSALPQAPDLSDRPLVEDALVALTSARHRAREVSAIDPERTRFGIIDAGWSPSGRHLWAYGSLRSSPGPDAEEAAVHVWSAESKAQVFTAERDNAIIPPAWSGAGDHLALLGRESLSIIDIASGKRICQNADLGWSALGANRFSPDDVTLAWSPDDARLALGGPDALRVVDARTCRQAFITAQDRRKTKHAAWSPDGRFIATGGFGGVWDARTGALLKALDPILPEVGVLVQVAWSPDGSRLLADFGTHVSVLDAADWAAPESIRFEGAGVLPQPGRVKLRVPDAGAAIQAWSPDGAQIAFAGFSSQIRVFDATTGRESAVLRAGDADLVSVAWSPDGARIAAAARDGATTIWDVKTRRVVSRIWAKYDHVEAIAWSPDSARLSTAGPGDALKIWRLPHLAAAQTLSGHRRAVVAVAWSPDGARLASGDDEGGVFIWRRSEAAAGGWMKALSFDAGVKAARLVWLDGGARLLVADPAAADESVWDAGTGRRIAARPKTGVPIPAAPAESSGRTAPPDLSHERAPNAWTPDAAFVAWPREAGPDLLRSKKDVAVWDTRLGAYVAHLRGHDSSVNALAFSPDQRWIATGSSDRTVRLWAHWPDAASLVSETGALLSALEPLTAREKCRLGLMESAGLAICDTIRTRVEQNALEGAQY